MLFARAANGIVPKQARLGSSIGFLAARSTGFNSSLRFHRSLKSVRLLSSFSFQTCSAQFATKLERPEAHRLTKTRSALGTLRGMVTPVTPKVADSGKPKQQARTLDYNAGPLVWIDCEMTGLDFDNDRIIEIAVIITDGHLEPVDEGIEYIIQTPKEVLDKMDEWCQTTHGNSGLIQACIDSPHSYEDVSRRVVEYVQKWIPEKNAGLLAGSSVHADMRFLYRGMPKLLEHLSYRILDVSSVKEICRRWYPSVTKKERGRRTGAIAHRAMDDIKASIRELRFYQEHIFLPLEPTHGTESDIKEPAESKEQVDEEDKEKVDQLSEAMSKTTV